MLSKLEQIYITFDYCILAFYLLDALRDWVFKVSAVILTTVLSY